MNRDFGTKNGGGGEGGINLGIIITRANFSMSHHLHSQTSQVSPLLYIYI